MRRTAPKAQPGATPSAPDGQHGSGASHATSADGVARRSALRTFAPPTQTWFRDALGTPTPTQEAAWEAITSGHHTVIIAPTGSGKTLAAFMTAIDGLMFPRPAAGAAATPQAERGTTVLYVSPLKALAVDVDRNLRSPLAGIGAVAARDGAAVHPFTIGLRTGDTDARERRRLATHPPDILITTPESLFLMLTSKAREALRTVRTIIVDEVHTVVATKRGAHLAVTLERLEQWVTRDGAAAPQRIGLSATVNPHDAAARILAGGRPVTIVAPPAAKQWDVTVEYPRGAEAAPPAGLIPDSGQPSPPSTEAPLDTGFDPFIPALAQATPRPPAEDGVWERTQRRVYDLITAHHTTLVFANSRRAAERFTAGLNELAEQSADAAAGTDSPHVGHTIDPTPAAGDRAGFAAPARLALPAELSTSDSTVATSRNPVVARAHHGSVSREQRSRIEEALKHGEIPAVVATSSLELGIDMGLVDLVVQLAAPATVASATQRIGRAGHHVGAVSKGVVVPRYPGELAICAVVVERLRSGTIEVETPLINPLDVLAQQIVAMVAMDDWPVADLLELMRASAPFATLSPPLLESCLDMLSGRYPDEEFAQFAPRLTWDRTDDILRARPGAQRLAVTSGGTIPDRGLYGVFLAGEQSSRVGELDEEMVYESRIGDVFALGTSAWRIEDITHDRVIVTPAPGQPARLPFWHGDTPARSAELGTAHARLLRQLHSLGRTRATARLRDLGFDDAAAGALLDLLRDQVAATGALPTDRTIVVERFRDELGDWRVAIHSLFGGRVNAAWALALGARARERWGVDATATAFDDGIVLRIPETYDEESSVPTFADLAVPADQVDDLVQQEVSGSALFAARFRECAARALLLPRRAPGRRTPLWQQRRRASQLLEIAARHTSFPIVMETIRECLHDVYDMAALHEVVRQVDDGAIRVVEVTTDHASPFAAGLMFGFVAGQLYEGDNPLAERRAQALSLDPALLNELLGRSGYRDLLDAGVVAAVDADVQRLASDRRCTTAEQVADLVRTHGPLTEDEVAARCNLPANDPGDLAAQGATARAALDTLIRTRRIIGVRIAGAEMVAAVEDAARLRDALGVVVPASVPVALLTPVRDPLGDLMHRYAVTRGPFTAQEPARRYGLGPAIVVESLRRLQARGLVVEGEFTPGRSGLEWVSSEVLQRIRRRTLAHLRNEIEPVEPATVVGFSADWQHLRQRLRGADGVLTVVDQLAGAPLVASAVESLILPARVADYRPDLLDGLVASGQVVWSVVAPLGARDAWIRLAPADRAWLLQPRDAGTAAPPPDADHPAVAAMGEADRALAAAILAVLSRPGGYFAHQVQALVPAEAGGPSLAQVERILHELLLAGLVTNDGFTALRRLLRGSPRTAAAAAPPVAPTSRSYRGRARASLRTAASTTGRWSGLASLPPLPTPELLEVGLAEQLLDRYGLIVRGVEDGERLDGGFARLYRTLKVMEEQGVCRRGYIVADLGGVQFATSSAIDRLRADATAPPRDAPPRVLAATDPANPFGTILPWPATNGGHRPSRAPGALVILSDRELLLYVERGGHSVLTFGPREQAAAACTALADAVRRGAVGALAIERVDGSDVGTMPLAAELARAGFWATPKGLRLRT